LLAKFDNDAWIDEAASPFQKLFKCIWPSACAWGLFGAEVAGSQKVVAFCLCVRNRCLCSFHVGCELGNPFACLVVKERSLCHKVSLVLEFLREFVKSESHVSDSFVHRFLRYAGFFKCLNAE
jgi:hypothetical protein